jgi:hypothetical protein
MRASKTVAILVAVWMFAALSMVAQYCTIPARDNQTLKAVAKFGGGEILNGRDTLAGFRMESRTLHRRSIRIERQSLV